MKETENGANRSLLFTFQRRMDAEDVTVHVEQSADLSSWTRVDFPEADVLVEEAGDVEIVTLRYLLPKGGEDSANQFFRLVAESAESD